MSVRWFNLFKDIRDSSGLEVAGHELSLLLSMKIGGIIKCSIIDYPGKVAAVLFTQGCNLKCPYCHNAELVIPEKYETLIPLEGVWAFLTKRMGRLEGVVVTGGEPTLQKDLEPFLSRVKQLGYAIKLDTNGTYPDVLKEVVQKRLVDYVAMDVKAPLEKYAAVTGVAGLESRIKESIQLLLASGVDYEFRTTLPKTLISKDDIKTIREQIKGAKRYRLQAFSPSPRVVDSVYAEQAIDNYSEEEFKALKQEFSIE